MKTKILTLLITLSATMIAAQNIIYVNHSATGNNDGSSWTNAYTSLDAALNSSENALVYVAKGTYTPGDGSKRTDFFELKKSVYGGFAGTETSHEDRDIKANPTILSGDYLGNDDNNISVGNQKRSENAQTVCRYRGKVLSGVIIEGGNADGTSGYAGRGAAIYGYGNYNGKITDCVFRNNSATYNSAVHFARSGGLNCWLRLDRCEFYNNSSKSGVVGQQGLGTHGSYLYIFNSLFHHNTISEANSGLITLNLSNHGSTVQGALHAEIVHNTFVNNTYNSSSATIVAGRNGEQGTSFLNAIIQNNIFVHGTIAPFKERIFANKALLSAVHFNYNVFNSFIGSYDAASKQQFYNVSGIDMNDFSNASNNNYTLKDCKNPAHHAAQFITDNDASYKDKNGVIRDSSVRDAGCYALTGITKVIIQRQGDELSLPNSHALGHWFIDSIPHQNYLGERKSLNPHKTGIYGVLSKDTATQCWSASNAYSFFFTQLQKLNKRSVDIYPNPAKDYIVLDPTWKGAQLQLFNNAGKLVFSQVVDQLRIDLNTLPVGLYHGYLVNNELYGAFKMSIQ
jgi:hypothetical protein